VHNANPTIIIVIATIIMNRALLQLFATLTTLCIVLPLHLNEMTTLSLVRTSNAALDSVILVFGPPISMPIDSGTFYSFVGIRRRAWPSIHTDSTLALQELKQISSYCL